MGLRDESVMRARAGAGLGPRGDTDVRWDARPTMIHRCGDGGAEGGAVTVAHHHVSSKSGEPGLHCGGALGEVAGQPQGLPPKLAGATFASRANSESKGDGMTHNA